MDGMIARHDTRRNGTEQTPEKKEDRGVIPGPKNKEANKTMIPIARKRGFLESLFRDIHKPPQTSPTTAAVPRRKTSAAVRKNFLGIVMKSPLNDAAWLLHFRRAILISCPSFSDTKDTGSSSFRTREFLVNLFTYMFGEGILSRRFGWILRLFLQNPGVSALRSRN